MTLHFNDISHYQGTSFPISGPIIAKATEGSDFTDSAYASNKHRTLAAGHPFAAYHFPLRAAAASMAAQAAHAKAVIGTATPVMMDIEKDINGHWISRDDCLKQIDIMQASGMQVVLAYIPEWFWSGCWDKASLTPFADRGLGLVSSQYVATYSDSGPGWAAYGGVKPVIWQYTDGLDKYAGGGLHHADTNAFKGTEAQLAALFNGTTEDENMAVTTADADLIIDRMVTRGLGSSGTPTIGVALQSGFNNGVETLSKVNQILAAMGQSPVPTVDVAALAAALAPLLPPETVTEDMIKAALTGVLNDAHLVVTP